MVKYFKSKQKQSLIALLNVIAGTLIILPYLIYNYIKFHNVIPISGYLKSSFPLITFTEKFTDILHYREIFFVIFAICFLLWYLSERKKLKSRADRYFVSGLAFMAGGVLILFAYIVFFMNWVVFSWYFITYSLFVSLAVSIPSAFILKKKKAGEIVFLTVLIFVSVYYGNKIYKYYSRSYTELGNNWNLESYLASQWIKKNSATDDIFAMKDAGHFGFYSERNVISLDGLVNNFEYQEVIKDKHLNDYFKRHNVKYLVQHAIWNREDVTTGNYDTLHIKFVSHKYSEESDPVIVRKSDEVYRSEPYYDGQYHVSFIIWKLKLQGYE